MMYDEHIFYKVMCVSWKWFPQLTVKCVPWGNCLVVIKRLYTKRTIFMKSAVFAYLCIHSRIQKLERDLNNPEFGSIYNNIFFKKFKLCWFKILLLLHLLTIQMVKQICHNSCQTKTKLYFSVIPKALLSLLF